MSTYAYAQLIAAIKQAREDVRMHQNAGETIGPQGGVDHVAVAVADAISADDPKFDREAFYRETGTLPTNALERLRWLLAEDDRRKL